MAERAKITRECSELVKQIGARRVIRESTRLRNIPSLIYREDGRTARPGSTVLVYREDVGWIPYSLVGVDGNEVHVVLLSSWISSFSINMVKLLKKNATPTKSKERKAKNKTKEAREPYNLR